MTFGNRSGSAGCLALLLTGLLAALPAHAQPARPRSIEALVREVRAAIGIESLTASTDALELRGETELFGLPATFVMLIDGQGRFLRRIDGRLGRVDGYDGHTAWEINHAGTPRVLELGDREDALIDAWMLSGWWSAEAAPLDFEAVESEDAETLTIGFRMQNGYSTGQIVIDQDTLLPREIRDTEGVADRLIRPTRYEAHDGLHLPGSVDYRTIGRDSTRTLTIGGATRVADVPADVFAFQPPSLSDVRFASAVPSAPEVRRALSGHVLVRATINDEADLGWFFFDTGAGASAISTSAAKRLGLESFGRVPAIGIGGRESARFYRADSLTVGPVSLDKPVFVGVDLSFVEGPLGMKIGGVLGYDLLARCIAEYDLSEGRVALHDPATYTLEQGEWHPLILYGGHPHVRARFEGHSGIFKIDTGSAGTVAFHAPTVERLELLDGREVTTTRAGGVGGSVEMRRGTMSSFELGGREFPSLAVSFAVESKGGYADPYVDGHVGAELLRPFIMVLDYGNRRIALIRR